MKKTVLLSLGLMAFLNIWQFFAGFGQREAAFASSWPHKTFPSSSRLASTSQNINTSSKPVNPHPQMTIATSATGEKRIEQLLVSAGLKPQFGSLYLRVEHQTLTPWQILAATHATETHQGDSSNITSSAGAVGPMQFMPKTFAAYAQDGNGDGRKDPTNLEDAMLTAGRYLAAGGADKGNYTGPLYSYNHSQSYVQKVMSLAHRLGLQN